MGVCNKHSINFSFITGFVSKIGEMVMVFWFKDIFPELALVFKGLNIFRLVSNVEEDLLCFALFIKLLWRRWRRCECFFCSALLIFQTMVEFSV